MLVDTPGFVGVRVGDGGAGACGIGRAGICGTKLGIGAWGTDTGGGAS